MDTSSLQELKDSFAQFLNKIEALKQTHREEIQKILTEINQTQIQDIKRRLGIE